MKGQDRNPHHSVFDHFDSYLRSVRRYFIPNERDRMIAKWRTDGGDYKLRFNYNLDKNSFVMDLGGYQGQWASDLFARYECCIAVFEPISTFAREIRERFHKNNKIEVFQYGLGGASRTEKIGVCADSSSTFRKSSTMEEVRIIDAAEWFAQRKIESVQLIKINIEGGEYDLLERLIETGLIKLLENIQVQFHPISKDSELRMKRIQNNLRKTHVPTYQYTFVWENWARN